MKVSVILPTYNERENISKLIHSILKLVKYPLEIIVVDDDSPDGTWKVVEKIKRRNKKIRLLRRVGKRGLASAIVDGVSLSKGNIIVWMDCDLSMPPELIPELIKTLKEHDVAIGSRYIKGGKDERKFLRVLTSRVINLLASLFLGFEIKDYTTGFVATKKAVLNNVIFSSKGHGEYCIEFLYKCNKNGYKVKEIPYTLVERKKGRTKTLINIFNFFKIVMIYCLTTLRLKIQGYR